MDCRTFPPGAGAATQRDRRHDCRIESGFQIDPSRFHGARFQHVGDAKAALVGRQAEPASQPQHDSDDAASDERDDHDPPGRQVGGGTGELLLGRTEGELLDEADPETQAQRGVAGTDADQDGQPPKGWSAAVAKGLSDLVDHFIPPERLSSSPGVARVGGCGQAAAGLT